MKKQVFIISAVISMGLLAPQFASGHPLTNADVTSLYSLNDEVTYEKIETDDLPEAVSNGVSETYAGYAIDQAYEGTDGTYKVSVSSGEMKYDLIYTKEGELSKVMDPDKE